MSDHETTLRAYHAEWQREMDATMGAGSLHGGRDPELAAACLAGADALRREKEIAEAVHYYTGEDVDELVQRYRDDPPAMMPAPTEPTR